MDTKPCIKIDKGVPLPAGEGRGRPILYPFADMEVGDSFSAPLDKRPSVSAIAARKKRFPNRRFTIRREGETVRVWRVA